MLVVFVTRKRKYTTHAFNILLFCLDSCMVLAIWRSPPLFHEIKLHDQIKVNPTRQLAIWLYVMAIYFPHNYLKKNLGTNPTSVCSL